MKTSTTARPLTMREYALLDDILARLIDLKIAGGPVTDEHLVLVVRLQQMHEHTIAQRWSDGQDVAYCILCGESWGDTHTIVATADREDGIDWPIWACTCGCGAWGAR